MPWIPRPLGPNLCYHVRVQCNNRSFRFAVPDDFKRYIDILVTERKKLGFLLHHFTIMSTHVHLIVTTPGPILLDQVMKMINHRYAVNYHRRHHRTGHFWMHGYRSAVIDTDRYALTCLRYLDRNPVRAGLVPHPAEWPWSAYQFYAHGYHDVPIDPHPSYLAMGTTDQQRQVSYRDFVETLMPSDETREKEFITAALHRYGGNWKRRKS